MKTKRFRTTEKHAPTAPARRYETKLDEKKRVVLRGARYKYYEVREELNGKIHLTPKKLVDIDSISARTLAMLDSSIANLKKGIVSAPIDLSTLRKKYSPRSQSQILPAKQAQKVRRPAGKVA
jgi:hypothetical protein